MKPESTPAAAARWIWKRLQGRTPIPVTATASISGTQISAGENTASTTPGVVLHNSGYCPTCDRQVMFEAKHPWLRDNYLCSSCGSIPRERALMHTLATWFPNWRDLVIHESSPCGRGASVRLARECRGYLPSQLFPNIPRGDTSFGVRSEDLEALTFPDASVDIHITQDVLEHLLHPDRAFRELARTLRPGGAHIFTAPLVNKLRPSRFRVEAQPDGTVRHLEPPAYHGNPLSPDGSLVTVDWGYDICRYILESSGLFTQIVYLDDLSRGIRAEYIEVLVTLKPASGNVPGTSQSSGISGFEHKRLGQKLA